MGERLYNAGMREEEGENTRVRVGVKILDKSYNRCRTRGVKTENFDTPGLWREYEESCKDHENKNSEELKMR